VFSSRVYRICLALGLLIQAPTLAQAEIVDGEELVDPTRPLFVSAAAMPEGSTAVMNMIRNVLPTSWDVSFIRAGASPMAVVNSERVTIGDSIGGASVVAIDRSSVTLSINGEERRISMYGEGIKTPVSQ